MKTKVLLTAFLAGATLLVSCDDDNIRVNSTIRQAFKSQYPSAKRVEWERKANFYVADFHIGGTEAEAWYTHDGTWQMTETDIRYAELPGAVRTGFEAGDYAGWRIDDIDKVERGGLATIYVIEVERGEAEYCLYYSEEGLLIKAVPESQSGSYDYLPAESPSAIDAYISQNYPGARIVEREVEKGMIEVDIVDGTTVRELTFTLDGEWVSTKTEVRYTNVPEVVRTALSASEYGAWQVDDTDFYQTPADEFYLFELESGDREVYIKIDTEGNILQ